MKLRRRELIALLAGTAATPMLRPPAARAQPAMPVIGFLHSASPDINAARLRAFRQGLKDTGYVEGENLAIEYRWADNQIDRLPALAADLVRRPVAVIATSGGTPAAAAAKAATATIPLVFCIGEDPVRVGLVTSLARTGGNVTGISFFAAELAAKRLELLREMVPATTRVAVLVNPANAAIAEPQLGDAETAARAKGLQVRVLNAGTSGEINAAFASFERERPDALLVLGDPFFNNRRLQLVLLAARHVVPASYASREYPEHGGLMSYGANITDAHRQLGVYTGRILKGAKPAELPVQLPTKYELVINAETARMLGLTVPPQLLATADEVIE